MLRNSLLPRGVDIVMDAAIQQALETERTIDITTTGRRSGEPSRIEMWFHNVDGEIYITGMPGARDWYANLLADPSLTFHLKQSARADLDGKAIPISDPAERQRVLETITRRINSRRPLDEWVKRSPLIRVEFE